MHRGGETLAPSQSPLQGLFQLAELRSQLDKATAPSDQARLKKKVDAKASEVRGKLQHFPALERAVGFVITWSASENAAPVTETWRQHIVPQFYLRGFRHNANA